jgi:hypothetical protein
METPYDELWRELRNANNPLADDIGALLGNDSEEVTQAQLAADEVTQELCAEREVSDDLRDELECAESVIEDKLVEIDALKASLTLANRLGQALLKHRSKAL